MGYVAWDGNTYQGEPPTGWYRAPADGRWWPEGSGPQQTVRPPIPAQHGYAPPPPPPRQQRYAGPYGPSTGYQQTRPPRRPWWQKKRFIIPLGAFAAIVVIGALASPDTNEDTVAASSPTSATVAQPASTGPASSGDTPTTTPEPTAAPASTAATIDMSPGQRNAVRQAESYLEFTAFSRSGLIKQLEFEGYSAEDATFAVDKVAPDWNEQAAKKAQDYLDLSAFSRSGLIDQLEFEGFTTEQATYGVDQVGL